MDCSFSGTPSCVDKNERSNGGCAGCPVSDVTPHRVTAIPNTTTNNTPSNGGNNLECFHIYECFEFVRVIQLVKYGAKTN
jgi:hypothetical protein